MVKVWNMRDPNRPKDAVYIGRAVPSQGIKASIWGNPFQLPRRGNPYDDVNARQISIDSYRRWLCEGGRGSPFGRIHELTGKDLVCWCAPLPCHGDVLLEHANPRQAVKLTESGND